MGNKQFDDIPLVLETIDETLWKEEIAARYAMIMSGVEGFGMRPKYP
jgi:endonuclease IV